MKKIITSFLTLSIFCAFGQTATPFSVEIEPITITNAPGVHSFSWGKTTDGKWVVLGGRLEGLHQRQPFSAFNEQDNNKSIYVIDPVSEQVWSQSLSSLPASLFEQLQSTNQQFFQRDTMLYITGGYGYSAIATDHTTFSNLTALSLNEVAASVVNGTAISSFFRQINDSRFAVTGGQMGYLNSKFYLVGGQKFIGRYNPMGPNNGPGFVQQYSEEIKRFEIIDDGTSLSIANYTFTVDTTNLHRRDYNMAPQIFPNGTLGYTAFSGVFQPNVDLPFLNSVNITETNYVVNNSFSQYLSQYHSAKIPIFDGAENAMNTIFFGGISQYTMDNSGNLVQDDNVPFVKTISKVVRYSDSSMQEIKLPIEMPTLVGSGAEFIPIDNYYSHEILYLDSLPTGRTLVGYIYGGIESTLDNIFSFNDGTQSSASNLIFKVYINKAASNSINEQLLGGDNVFNLSVYPNPSPSLLNLEFYNPSETDVNLIIYSADGKLVLSKHYENLKRGNIKKKVDLAFLPSGSYEVEITNGIEKTVKQIIKK